MTSRALGLSPSRLPNVTSHCLFSLRAEFCLSHLLALSPEHHGQRLPISMTKNNPMVGMPFAEIRALPEREQSQDPSLYLLSPSLGPLPLLVVPKYRILSLLGFLKPRGIQAHTEAVGPQRRGRASVVCRAN